MKRIKLACFITGGLTEAASMKFFLKKINGEVDFIQLCPICRKKSKKQIRDRAVIKEPKHNGITGEKLLEYVYEFIQKEAFLSEEYDGILIEDDKDNRFLEIAEDGSHRLFKATWEKHKEIIYSEIKKKCFQMANKPIIIMYAAPEVESWFLADWEHSFAIAYKRTLGEMNHYFQMNLRKFINNQLLGGYENDLESFGFHDDAYIKLSENIQNVISTGEYLQDANNVQYNKDIFENKNVRYSKAINGAEMLEEIIPEIVASKCRIAFEQGFQELKHLEYMGSDQARDN